MARNNVLEDSMCSSEVISTKMPYQSHYQEVLGSKVHYIDEGQGDPVIFLHGMPTSSYLWRNIIPPISSFARCIAPDLIGMGKSDKPDIEYRIFDHIKYIEAFISALELENVTFVLHGWGSVIGFHYAEQHEVKIKGLAFYESQVRPMVEWEMLSLPVQQLASLLQDPEASYKAVVEDNFFIEKLLPRGVLRELKPEEMETYREPFQTPESRNVLWQFVLDRPLGDGSNDVTELISSYSNWLQKTQLPKLLMYSVPGFISTIATVKWCKEHFPNLTLEDLGDGLHFIQETDPKLFSNVFTKWYKAL